MALRKQKGNMYEFVTHVWSPLRGKCEHDCSYCYMKKFELDNMNLDMKDLMTPLGKDRIIFVGHTVDLFASNVPTEWIELILKQLNSYPKNRYLLQSKNPIRILDFIDKLPPDVFIGTTIETNRTEYYESKAPSYTERAKALGLLSEKGLDTMVTIEPIFDFDLDELVELVMIANPGWINVGADSKGHDLPEPSKEKVTALITELQSKTKVELKQNLDRILEGLS
jgi:DNA repair photolyase